MFIYTKYKNVHILSGIVNRATRPHLRNLKGYFQKRGYLKRANKNASHLRGNGLRAHVVLYPLELEVGVPV